MKIKIWKLLIHSLFSKRLRYQVCNVLLYALKNHQEKRGEGSCDVIEFKVFYGGNFIDYD